MPGRNWRALLPKLARVSWVGAQEVMKVHRKGTVQTVKLKAGGEIALLADENASRAMGDEWARLLADIKRVDEEEESTHALLAEGGEKGITDPIDGSGVFQLCTVARPSAPILGWGSTVGIMVDGVVQAGVIHQIGTRQLFVAIKGEGCWWIEGEAYDRFWESGELPELSDALRYRLEDLQTDDAEQPLIVAAPSSSKMDETSFDAWMGTRWKSWEYKLIGNELAGGCAVANVINALFGFIAAYLNVGGGVAWDLAVAGLVYEEAGGWVSDLEGNPLVWKTLKLKTLFARNEATARRFLSVL